MRDIQLPFFERDRDCRAVADVARDQLAAEAGFEFALQKPLERLRNVRREIRAARRRPEVHWVVREVELEDVWIGDLEVNFAVAEFRVHGEDCGAESEASQGCQKNLDDGALLPVQMEIAPATV
jgi:hypothetical protein